MADARGGGDLLIAPARYSEILFFHPSGRKGAPRARTSRRDEYPALSA